MTLRRHLLLIICGVCALGWNACAVVSAVGPGAQQVNARAAAINEFYERIKAFRQLHEKLEHRLNDPMQASTDASTIATGENRLTFVLRQVRQNAKQGEFFTPAVTPIFREIITTYFKGENPKLETDPKDRPAPFVVKINVKYPSASPVATMPPKLLESLPKLPEDLSYRFIERTLILVDSDTDLILDYIPSASRPVK